MLFRAYRAFHRMQNVMSKPRLTSVANTLDEALPALSAKQSTTGLTPTRSRRHSLVPEAPIWVRRFSSRYWWDRSHKTTINVFALLCISHCSELWEAKGRCTGSMATAERRGRPRVPKATNLVLDPSSRASPFCLPETRSVSYQRVFDERDHSKLSIPCLHRSARHVPCKSRL